MPPVEDGEVHALLEPPTARYSSAAVQRAFVVWTLLGHSHPFRNVADYYRRLEQVEETFSPERRKESRDYEYSLLTAQPPTSECLLELFPRLYPKNKVQYRYPEEMTKDSGFKVVPDPKEPEEKNGASTKEIVEASQLIRTYCKTRQLNIREFLTEFQTYATKYGVNPTVSNVAFYIKHRDVQQERMLATNYSKYDLAFLSSSSNNCKDIGQKTNTCAEDYDQSPIVENGVGKQNGSGNLSLCSKQIQSNVELPLAIQQAETLYNNAPVMETRQKNEKNLLNSERNTTECGIDDVLNKIADLNQVFGEEINNDTITVEKKDPVATKHTILEKKSTAPYSYIEHIEHINSATKDSEGPYYHHVFAKKNKNRVISTAASLKKPSYCMKLKVKSKRSQSQAKRNKSKEIKDLAKEDSFKSCELNMSCNLIDLDSSEEQFNFFNDFDRTNFRRCSTSSR